MIDSVGPWPWGIAFLGGVAGSLHCLGMCGGFAAILARAERPVVRGALYNGGRVASLTLIGAVSGGLGAALVHAGPVLLVSRVLAIGGGLLMVLVGLELLGVPTRIGRFAARFAQATVGQAMAPVLRAPSMAAPLAFGVLNAFLPCHLVWAFAAQAATLASPSAGAALMLAFGLGTLPVMMLAGSVAGLAVRGVRGVSRAAGLLVVIVGLITVVRGTPGLPSHLEHGQQRGGDHQLEQREHSHRGGELP